MNSCVWPCSLTRPSHRATPVGAVAAELNYLKMDDKLMALDRPLAGRTALITGASRGIGRAVVEALSAAGARTFLLGRERASLEVVAKSVAGELVVGDLANPDSLAAALNEVASATDGAPDIVVNSAGVFSLASLAECGTEEFDRHFPVNLRGTFLVNRRVLPTMLERGAGRLVNVGSVSGRRAFPANGAYSASKFGLRGLHEVLLEELRGTGVQATLVEPSATDTELWDPLEPDADPYLPNRADMLRAEEVAEAIRFVVSRPPGVAIPYLPIERR